MNTKLRLMVQYIGRREIFEDRLYGSGLTFVREQIRSVPVVIARKLLRHSDNFVEPKPEAAEVEKSSIDQGEIQSPDDNEAPEKGEQTEPGETTEPTEPTAQAAPTEQTEQTEQTEPGEKVDSTEDGELSDETDAQLERGRIERERAEEAARNIQDIHDTVNSMEKDSLKEFAFTKFKQNIDKRQTVEAMRAQVHQFIDQFGVA